MKYKIYEIRNNKDFLLRKIIGDFLNKKDLGDKPTILIKTDLGGELNSPETASTIDARTMDVIIDELNRNIGPGMVIIGESEKNVPLETVFQSQGYDDIKKKYKNVKLVNLSRTECVRTSLENPKILRNVLIPEDIIICDLLICVSRFKRHIMERVSGSMMNLYELISDRDTRVHLQPFLKETIYDICNIVSPSLSILDMDMILEGTGPFYGEARNMGLLIAGDSPLITDIAATRVIGENYNKVSHLRYMLNMSDDKKSIKRSMNDIRVKKNTEFIKKRYHSLFRLSNAIKRISMRIENLGLLSFLSTYALISIGGRNLVKGRWVPLKQYYSISKQILCGFEERTDLFRWKISINKHVEQETIS
jgi:uncharacterized protein (DUF362 family)